MYVLFLVSPTNELVIFEEKEEEVKAEKEEERKLLWCETVPLVEVEIKLKNKVNLTRYVASLGLK